MCFRDYSTVQIVQHCLQQGKEGEYWDFKQEWHKRIQDLLKDIICFANTVHHKKCYIIFGIADNLKIVGMTEPRKKQADIIDALSNLHFAGDVSPKISVETVMISGVELDVLIIDNVERTPVYLNRDYGNMKRGCIYARVQDRNTSNNGNADMEIIENLWRKRMGLIKPPYEYIIDRLKIEKSGRTMMVISTMFISQNIESTVTKMMNKILWLRNFMHILKLTRAYPTLALI